MMIMIQTAPHDLIIDRGEEGFAFGSGSHRTLPPGLQAHCFLLGEPIASDQQHHCSSAGFISRNCNNIYKKYMLLKSKNLPSNHYEKYDYV